MAKRYAIYFTLSQSDPIYQTASDWLGYDAYSGQKKDIHDPVLVPTFLSNENCVNKAARYGFHATLKPPFRLNQNKTEQQLIQALEDFAATTRAFSCMPLTIKTMSDFLALIPEKNCQQLNLLAAQCLKNFEPFRAVLTHEEYQKRNPHLLNARQLGYLKQWGYPYVEDEFRFHMTLTDEITEIKVKKVKKNLMQIFKGKLGNSLQVDQIYLFRQNSALDNFHIISSHPLRKTF